MRITPCFLASLWLLAGCGIPSDFRASFEGEVVDFNCENQQVFTDSAPRIRDLPPGRGPGDRMIGLEKGRDRVAWLTHLEDDGDSLRNDEFLYTIALVLKERAPGRHAFPSESASAVFFCNNWGRGFRACEAKATGGWLRVDAAAEGELTGEFDLTMQGHKERPDKSREPVTIRLQGRFNALR
jgi:hypothetical protein